MAAADVAGVLAVAAAVHREFPERREVFEERLSLFPEGCHALHAADGRVVGYAVSHPWHADRPVLLDTLIGSLPPEGTRYIHDVAVLPELRGAGHAGQIVGRIVRDAYRAGAPSVSLVSVSGSGGFWERYGFRERREAGLAAKLASYGPDARFMARDLRL